MVQFRTDIRTVHRMQEMMTEWMNIEGRDMDLELSSNRWIQRLGDFVMTPDLKTLGAEDDPDACLICELGGRAPTKKALIYRFVCHAEGRADSCPTIMDVEETIYDEACRKGRWEVISRPSRTPIEVHLVQPLKPGQAS
jgi:hypothetical protein